MSTAVNNASIDSPKYVEIMRNLIKALNCSNETDTSQNAETCAFSESLNNLLVQFQKLNKLEDKQIHSESFNLDNLTAIERKLFGENHQNVNNNPNTPCEKFKFETKLVNVNKDEKENPLDFNWINNSVNSYSGTDTAIFTKIQISDLTDPLINEVIVNKALNAFENKNEPKRFSQYKDHFLIKSLPGQPPDKSFYALQTEHINMLSIGNFLKNLSDPIKGIELEYTNPVVKKVLAQLDKFVGYLMEVGGKIGFVHNDIHMGNVVLDTNAYMGTGRQLVYKLIDYGRSSITNYTINADDVQKYCMTVDQVKSILNANFTTSWKRFQVPAYGKNYMCDSASICLAICLHIGGFPWPEWITIKYNNNDYDITIDTNMYGEIQNYTEYKNIYKALLWMSVCIEKYLFHYTKDQNIKTIKLSLLRKSLLLGNFVFNAVEFQKISDVVNTFFELNENLLQGGGKSIKKKLNRKKKMSGGTPENPQQPVTTSQMPPLKDFDDCMKSTNTLIGKELPPNLETLEIGKMLDRADLFNKCTQYQGNALSCAAQMRTTEQSKFGALPAGIPTGVGGARPLQTQKTYKIITDKVTARRYIRKSNKQWFLDENRGKYKYTDETKKFIKMK